jgi:hypothetical protein
MIAPLERLADRFVAWVWAHPPALASQLVIGVILAVAALRLLGWALILLGDRD